MILRSLELQNFRSIAEGKFSFRRGMNLVYGPNESGKTTLAEAVLAVLFGSGEEEVRSWGGKGDCLGRLLLSGSVGTVRLARDFATNRVSLVETDDLGKVRDRFEGKTGEQAPGESRAMYSRHLQGVLGMSDPELCRASLYFGHQSLSAPGAEASAAKIKGLLCGFVEVDYDRVLAELARDYFSLTSENPWGEAGQGEQELETVRSRLRQIDERLQSRETALQELDGVRERIAALKTAPHPDRSVTGEAPTGNEESAARRTDLLRRIEEIREQEARRTELTERRDRLAAESLSDMAASPVPEPAPLDAEREGVRKRLHRAQQEALALRNELVSLKAPGTGWPLGGSAVAAAVGGGIFFLDLLPWLWLVPPVLLGMGSPWIPYLVRRRDFGRKMGELQERLQGAETAREDALERLDHLDAQSSPPVQQNEDEEQLKEAEIVEETADAEADADRAAIERELKTLPEAEQLARERERLTAEMEALEKQEPATHPVEHTTAHRLAELHQRQAELSRDLAETASLQLERERLVWREQRLRHRKRVLMTAVELLSRAVEAFRSTYRERFATELSSILRRLSAGRYPEVRLDEDFAAQLRHPDGDWQPVSRFSRGTRDAVLLATRLALAKHLAAGHELPLLFDEPLAHLDPQRQGTALKLLERVAREHQVVLFTHDRNLLKRATRDRWHVISLVKEGSVQTEEPEERRDDGGQLHLL